MSRSCTCEHCIGACESLPGFFSKGQLEGVADFLGITVAQLKSKRVEQIEGAWRPRIGTVNLGMSFLHGATCGRCTFLTDDNRCQIQPVKPDECRLSMPCAETHEKAVRRHMRICRTWAK